MQKRNETHKSNGERDESSLETFTENHPDNSLLEEEDGQSKSFEEEDDRNNEWEEEDERYNTWVQEDETYNTWEEEDKRINEEEYLAEVGEMNCYCVPTRVYGFKDFMFRTLGWTLLNKEQILGAFTGKSRNK